MTTITKERLLTIQQWRETYGPGSNVVLPAEEAEELVRIALASLEAEPVAYIFKHPAGKLFWALTDESNKEQADVIPVYAAAPASVVPDNASEPLAYAYKELTPEIIRNHLAVFERYGLAPNDSSTTIQALRIALDGIERSDAMLHGAEPVSQTYKLPVNTPCQDAPAHIWLQTAGVWPEDGELSELTWCIHNQHHDDTLYVRADLVNGNSPVTPDGWISCSERMPEKYDFDIWVFSLSRGVLDGLQWDGSMFTDDEYQFVIHDATHWKRKAYPAAPQQEVE
ncbi:DUF551 domain-containing protein [Escherichia coli O41:H45]|nr:DUF551 domain-containing protein [Escherichia coli O41:H45]